MEKDFSVSLGPSSNYIMKNNENKPNNFISVLNGYTLTKKDNIYKTIILINISLFLVALITYFLYTIKLEEKDKPPIWSSGLTSSLYVLLGVFSFIQWRMENIRVSPAP